MRLEDIEAKPFGMLVHWLHTQSLSDCVKETDESTKLLLLAKLWTLAGRCLIPALQDLTSNWVRGLVVMCAGDEPRFRDFIHYAYETKEENTALKRIAADKLALQVEMTVFGEVLRDLPEGMLMDVTMALKRKVLPSAKSMNDPAVYFLEQSVEKVETV